MAVDYELTGWPLRSTVFRSSTGALRALYGKAGGPRWTGVAPIRDVDGFMAAGAGGLPPVTGGTTIMFAAFQL